MKALRWHLWKEWREQRRALLVLVLLSSSIAIAAAGFAPAWYFHTEGPLLVGVGLVVVPLLLQIGELAARDASGPARRFLERLPRGVQRAFVAKLVLLLSLLTAALLLAGTLWLACAWWTTSLVSTTRALEGFLHLAGAAYLLGLWTIAVSAWVPRGSLALPVGTLALAVSLAPVFLLRARGYWPEPWEGPVAWMLCSLQPLGVAAASFVPGRRFGRSGLASARRGLPLALPGFLPILLWCGWRVAEHAGHGAHCDDLRIVDAIVCQDGRHVLASTVHEGSHFLDGGAAVYVIDGSNGEARRLGDGVLTKHGLRT